MQTLMVKSGSRYRKASPSEVAEVAGFYARTEFNRVRPMLDSPDNAIAHLRAIFAGVDHESFHVLFLDVRMRLIACEEMFRGTIDQAPVFPREVAKEAILRAAAGVVLAHNHPSGVAQPSNADIRVTQQLTQALALVEVSVIDHLIIGSGGEWCSMKSLGMI